MAENKSVFIFNKTTPILTIALVAGVVFSLLTVLNFHKGFMITTLLFASLASLTLIYLLHEKSIIISNTIKISYSVLGVSIKQTTYTDRIDLVLVSDQYINNPSAESTCWLYVELFSTGKSVLELKEHSKKNRFTLLNLSSTISEHFKATYQDERHSRYTH